jgi:hypothetical protein
VLPTVTLVGFTSYHSFNYDSAVPTGDLADPRFRLMPVVTNFGQDNHGWRLVLSILTANYFSLWEIWQSKSSNCSLTSTVHIHIWRFISSASVSWGSILMLGYMLEALTGWRFSCTGYKVQLGRVLKACEIGVLCLYIQSVCRCRVQ